MIRKTAIRQIKGHCPDCPEGSPVKVLTAGRCSIHYWKHRQKENATRERQSRMERAGILGDEAKEIKDSSQLDGTLKGWFDYWIRFCGFACEECGEHISRSDIDGLYAAQAHILPKADNQFPSVKTVIHNHMTLGARCGCHSRFDKSWESAQKMKVWGAACLRFELFCHLIAPKEVRKLPPSLREIYDSVMLERNIDV
jgi:hypothetical protein